MAIHRRYNNSNKAPGKVHPKKSRGTTMTALSQLEEIVSGVNGAKVIAYSSLALDKVVLLVLFLLKRMDSPGKTGFQAGFIFGHLGQDTYFNNVTRRC